MRFEPEKTPDIVIVLLLPLVALSLAIFVTLAALAGFSRLFAAGAWDKREAVMSAPRRLWVRLSEPVSLLRSQPPPRIPLYERALILAGNDALKPSLSAPSGPSGVIDDRGLSDIEALTQSGLLRLISDALDEEHAERAARGRVRREKLIGLASQKITLA